MRVRFPVSPVLMTLAVGLVTSTAQAQLTTYQDETQFVTAVGATSFESFENLAPRARTTDPITASAFTVTPTPGLIGIQDSPNSPDDGSGSFATDGTHYLYSYLPGQPTGTLRFDLNHPTTFFGFDIIDVGEIDGTLSLQTNSGAAASGFTAATYPPLQPNGNIQFFGFQQATPFTQVFLTVTGKDDAYGLDKIYTASSGTAVPEPGAFVQAFAGVIVGGALLRRRRK